MKFGLCRSQMCASMVALSAGAVMASTAFANPEPRPVADRDSNVQYLRPGQRLGPVPRGEPTMLCTINESNSCQVLEFPRVAGTSYGSMGAGGLSTNVCADHFRTGNAGGTVTEFCWWGTYGTACALEPTPDNDRFIIRILPRMSSGPDTGAPDTNSPLATFTQGIEMTVTRRDICDVNARATTEYTATVTGGVALDPNTCYFIEISNPVDAVTPGGAANWFWSRTAPVTDNVCYRDLEGTGYTNLEQAAGDRAFCVGLTLDIFGSQLCLPPVSPPPDNDSCFTATAISGSGTTSFDNTNGTTNVGEGQSNPECTSAGNTSAIEKDLWFAWTAGPGTPGQIIRATVGTCGSAMLIDSKIAVYNGTDCNALTIVDCIDDVCDQTPVNNANVPATVSFNAVVGQSYRIQVGGSGPGAVGLQSLFISSSDATGRCCLPNGNCADLTMMGCMTAGGTFGGTGSSCASQYTSSTGTAALETLSSPTTITFAQGDDDYTNIPIGFDFDFYGERHSTINVGVNGQAGFGSLYPFANTWPIPTHLVEPNAYLAVAADDYLVAGGGGCGNVLYQTLGSGASQRLVIEWSGICHFSSVDSNTFQAILYANGNIEYRYGAMNVPEITPTAGTAGPGYIRGIESESGAGSIDLSGPNGEQAAPAAGSSVLFTYNSDPANVCPAGNTCPCDWNDSGGINSQDFFDFLVDFFAGNADINMSGSTNSQDFFDFLTCFFSPPMGC